MKLIHNCPAENLPEYAHSLSQSLVTVSQPDDMAKLPVKELQTVVLSLEVAYEILKAVQDIRQ